MAEWLARSSPQQVKPFNVSILSKLLWARSWQCRHCGITNTRHIGNTRLAVADRTLADIGASVNLEVINTKSDDSTSGCDSRLRREARRGLRRYLERRHGGPHQEERERDVRSGVEPARR